MVSIKTTLNTAIGIVLLMGTLSGRNMVTMASEQAALPSPEIVCRHNGSTGDFAYADLAYTPDSTGLAVSTPHGVALYDLRTLTEQRVLPTDALVVRMQFAPDGQFLATQGMWNQPIQVWRVSDGTLLHTLTGTSRVFAFAPDGEILAVAQKDEPLVKFWRVVDGVLAQTVSLTHPNLHLIEQIAFAPDGAMLATASRDGSIRLWRVADGKLIRELRGHQSMPDALTFSGDGQILASASYFDGTVRVWQVNNGALRQTFQGPPPILTGFRQEESGVGGFIWSADRHILTVVYGNGAVFVWRWADGELIAHVDKFPGQFTDSYEVAFAPRRQWRASAMAGLITLQSVSGGELFALANRDPVTRLLFAPDEHTLVAGSNNGIVRLWRLPELENNAPDTASCEGAPFGAQKQAVCRSRDCLYFEPPLEIKDITHGGYAEFVGLFINDGYAAWYGFDLDRDEYIRVERYAGQHLADAPQAVETTESQFMRTSSAGEQKIVDVVTKMTLDPDHLKPLICLANQVWLWTSAEPPAPRITDIHQAVVLIDGTTLKLVGGPGVLAGDAEKLYNLLYAQFSQ